jgi:5-methylcytosine-specific restriction endonuclease McrA
VIRIVTGRFRLLARLGADGALWEGEAHRATERNRALGRHESRRDNLWSRLKPGLVDLQHGKCAYCESDLGSDGVDWTVDHHRPKAKVQAHPDLPERTVDVGGAAPTGYHLLAYDPDNFLGCCATCNKLKDTYFPTAARRVLDTGDRAALREEKPYLLDPSDLDDPDPERLITWRGPIPLPAPGLDEHDRRRALATIAVLGLFREKLVKDRIYVLLGVYWAHRDGDTRRLDRLCAPDNRFSACARRFRELCETDPAAAQEEFDLMSP